MLIGITGEEVRVKNAGSILQDFLRFFSKIQEVDSFCKKTFSRGERRMRAALQDLEQFLRKVYRACKADDFFKKISYNLNSVCKTQMDVISNKVCIC